MGFKRNYEGKLKQILENAVFDQVLRIIQLTKRPQFSMVYTPIDHRNDVIECSKLKWNHEPQAFIFSFLRSFSENHAPEVTFFLLFFVFCSTFAASSTILLSEISPHMLKFGSSLSMLRSKIIFTKNQKQYNRHGVTGDVIRASVQ